MWDYVVNVADVCCFCIQMKFILKGKEFLSKKLQQLDLASQGLDLVAQQIPHRLKQSLKVLQSNQIDLQSNDKYQSYFKNYPNHHISHYLLEKMNMALEADTPAPEYRLQSQASEVFVPVVDRQLQRRALLLKQVVDEYQEGYHKVEDPVLCMAVIHFHHKRGTEIEHRFPASKAVEEIENLIVHHAMPDSSHNKMEDYNFFNFEAVWKGKRRMLFGVSYFKQIKVTEDMKAKNSEITRSYLQKAIAVVSTLPLFGYLKLRLASTTKAFFTEFNNYALIDAAYKQLSKGLGESWPKLEMNQLCIGSDLKVIIDHFGATEFYEIWKAVLYQKRVVIFAHSSSSASSFILSLLTLFPGLSTFGIFSKPISRYMQSLREYALPLRTFSSDNFMAMSFHIQDFHLLSRFQKSNNGSFLIGTTNRLLKEANDYGIEMLINLENCTVEKKKPRVPWEQLSKAEKQFIAQIEEVIKIEKTGGYEGSEDMIRNKFHNFLKLQLVGIMKAAQSLRTWMSNCQEYQRKNQRKTSKQLKKQKKEYEVMAEQGEDLQRKKSEDFPPLIPTKVTGIPFPGLLLTKSFPYFLQFHNEKIPDIMAGKIYPSLLIENYDYCLSLSRQEFLLYNWSDNKISFGKGTPQNYQGKEMRFLSDCEQLTARYIFIGQVENYRFVKTGFFLDRNEHYQGEYENGAKEGYGKLTNSVHKYIGNFRNNLYEGQGQLVTGKDIYVGQFREGMKHGFGKNQGELNYDGEWANNRPEGNGVLKIGQDEYIARFVKGEIDETQEVTIRFQNGAMYKGFVKDKKASGRGYLIDERGTTYGQFREGILIREIGQQKQQQKEQGPKSNPIAQT